MAQAAAGRDVDLQLELTSCQVETATGVIADRADLFAELTRLRSVVAKAAKESGATLLAVALPPTIPQEFPITDKPRYQQIANRFGMIAHEQGISGCHVHVEVPDRDTAVAVCTRLRPWLPMLLALSANSAIYRNTDTGYSSWRSILWARWPSAGPPPELQSAAEYDETVAAMEDTGAMLDDGMVYWDARPSAKSPTVEVRVADVPATVAETVLLATVTRALVMAVLGEIRCGIPETLIADPVLRASYWLAARDGMSGARLGELLTKVTPELHEIGEYNYVTAELDRITGRGNGATRQRRAWQRRGDVTDVLAEAARATLE